MHKDNIKTIVLHIRSILLSRQILVKIKFKNFPDQDNDNWASALFVVLNSDSRNRNQILNFVSLKRKKSALAINEEYWGVNDECLDSEASHIRLGVVAQRQKRKSYQDRWHLMDTTTSLALLAPDFQSLERILTKYSTNFPLWPCWHLNYYHL